ncbi:MAG: potassium transporter TrkG, partial [Longimicrobiales bacterium]
MPVPGDLLESLEREAARSLPFWRRLTAPQLFVGSFVSLVLLGTALLYFLPGVYTGDDLSLVDALFTATSAVCVTGLIVVDTATYFTPFGQGVLLLLIQLGGLGILSLTTLLIIAMGRRLSLRSEQLAGSSEAVPHLEPRSLVRTMVLYTFVTEAAGALLLYLFWLPRFGVEGALWPALFHAISAFCNAGFSVFSDNLVGFSGSAPTLLVMGALIVVGGLGSVVLAELKPRLSLHRRARPRAGLSVHTRLVLATTGILLLGGTALFLLFEWNNALADRGIGSRLAEALFMAITPRTAGFNTAQYALLTPGSLFLTIGLMMIGGSPGSTAGGLKTTTFALVFLLAYARFRGHEHTGAFRRTIPDATSQRAVGLVVAVMAMLGGAILLLLITEFGARPYSETGSGFMQLTFEAVSAFNTVGLSTGIT